MHAHTYPHVSQSLFTEGRDTSPKEVYMVLGIVMVPIFYFAGAGSAVFWIIGEFFFKFSVVGLENII